MSSVRYQIISLLWRGWSIKEMTRCRNKCGTDIMFEDDILGPLGRNISFHLDGTIHNCPNSLYS